MTTIARNSEIRLVRPAASEAAPFRVPNPGDVFLLVAFVWAVMCFLLVVAGDRFLRPLAAVISSPELRRILLTEQSALALVMVVGISAIAAGFFVISRYRAASLAMFFFSMVFAAAFWPPVYFVAFGFKYLFIIYLASFAALFLIRNGWQLVGMSQYRLPLIYVCWIFLVVLINGFKFVDVWYFGTEFVLMLGFAIAWLGRVDSREAVERFNRLFAYAAVAVTLLHLLSPLVIPNFTVGGRFVSMFNRATGFSVNYSLFVVAMFWMAMYEKRMNYRNVFLVVATVGFGLILWSGTRSAVVASLIAIAALWWIFRNKIFVYIGFIGLVAFLVQLILGGVDDVIYLAERLQSTQNDRLGAWELYLDLALKSPVFGYGYSGLANAVYGETLVSLLRGYRNVSVPGVHNFYIGFAVRFGFVGLGLLLLMFFTAFWYAARVIFSPRVSPEDKQVYILPVALLMLVALQGLFEDIIGSTGRGTLHGVAFAAGFIILRVWGEKLLHSSMPEASARANVLHAGQSRSGVLSGGVAAGQ